MQEILISLFSSPVYLNVILKLECYLIMIYKFRLCLHTPSIVVQMCTGVRALIKVSAIYLLIRSILLLAVCFSYYLG